MKSFKFFKPSLATTLAIGSWRLVFLLATAVSLVGYPKPASAATINVSVGASRPLIGYFFAPSSVTIHPGDQVKWTWASDGHSTTSGRPGMPNGIWDSGIRNQGATFTHTFNSVGTFPYYCSGLGEHEVGKVIVTDATPPIVSTNLATNVSNFSVTLNGTVNPNGLSTAVDFEYGTTTDYGTSTAIQNYSGGTTQNAFATVSNLSAGATYHFRIVGSNTAGTTYGADSTFITPAARAVVADFNGDSAPDLLVHSTSLRQTVALYLSNNAVIGAAVGLTLPTGWSLGGAADFNGDGDADYAVFNFATGQTVIVYLSGLTVVGAAFGPSLSPGWQLVGTGDFNGDGHPDYVLYKPSTGETAIWHLNNNVFLSAATGPPLPSGWNLVGVADFNSDGHPDFALFNSVTGQTVIGYLSDGTVIGAAFGPTIPVNWPLVATADFSQDGHPDYLVYNPVTGQIAIAYLNDTVVIGAALCPTLPAGWSLIGQ